MGKRSRGTLFRIIEDANDALVEKPYQVVGFMFDLDVADLFNPYTDECMKVAGFFDEKAPRPEGFLYVSKEYFQYVDQLILNDAQHPGNLNNAPWTHLGGHQAQHHTTPSLDIIDTVAIPASQPEL